MLWSEWSYTGHIWKHSGLNDPALTQKELWLGWSRSGPGWRLSGPDDPDLARMELLWLGRSRSGSAGAALSQGAIQALAVTTLALMIQL
jgi:hypothetical protein